MRKPQLFCLILILLITAIIPSLIYAGTTGKLAGKITDEDGAPVPFANIVLVQNGVGVTGGQSKENGTFFIINISPGTYDIRVTQASYHPLTVTGVIIKLDETTTQSVTLIRSTIQIEGMMVTESSNLKVSKTKTGSGTTMNFAELERSSVETIDNAISLTAGVESRNGELHVRGGRSNEVVYSVEGLSVSDPVQGGSSLNIDKNAVQVMDIQTGGFTAEFGNAQSGIVNNTSDLSVINTIESTSLAPSIKKKEKFRNRDSNTEEYDVIVENEFKKVLDTPVSTFSIDVDAASYSNMRRFINNGQLPPKGAVRIEEMINYFSYDYPQPKGEDPFAVYTEISDCPWNEEYKLMHIGLQGKILDLSETPNSNLVFLIDASGSMSRENKMGLLKKGFKLMVENLKENDRVSIVVYAGAAGVVLPSTSGNEKNKIIVALDKLRAGGSTAGGAGIRLAYETAKKNFIEGGNNRVILATDGDFNVGISSTSELVNYIEEERKNGIFLTTLGFGMGNYKDDRMEQLANKGNGNYYYIDNILEAKKVLVKELSGTLYTIAKDVKLQLEFNPNTIYAYRLVGYENRLLNKEDFNDDTKDAGELGAGHTVTALYELILKGDAQETKTELPKVDDLKYQTTKISDEGKYSNELLTLKLRYKKPDEDISKKIEFTVNDDFMKLKNCSNNFRFSAAVASFGMLLRDSKFKGELKYKDLIKMAKSAKGEDDNGYRAEFIQLLEKAEMIEK